MVDVNKLAMVFKYDLLPVLILAVISFGMIIAADCMNAWVDEIDPPKEDNDEY